jgi:hypothetical protein
MVTVVVPHFEHKLYRRSLVVFAAIFALFSIRQASLSLRGIGSTGAFNFPYFVRLNVEPGPKTVERDILSL